MCYYVGCMCNETVTIPPGKDHNTRMERHGHGMVCFDWEVLEEVCRSVKVRQGAVRTYQLQRESPLFLFECDGR